jgi:hypothetical protein
MEVNNMDILFFEIEYMHNGFSFRETFDDDELLAEQRYEELVDTRNCESVTLLRYEANDEFNYSSVSIISHWEREDN